MLNPVKEVNELLSLCQKNGYTDIHLEPLRNSLRIRVREDGLLKTLKEYSSAERNSILSRIKVLAGLEVSARKILDGRFNFGEMAVRVSVLPVYWGEKIVLRLLPPRFDYSLETLGLPEELLSRIRKDLNRESGLILITGPTGSGKTTTLYALLAELDHHSKNITTIEDPIEYQSDTINQVQVDNHNISFAQALRSILRQDPDIIFIGEIRDQETASIAVRAALTGHLVIATLHTRNTKETIKRLTDLGIPSYLLEDSLNCIISQRLIRKLSGGVLKGRTGIFEYYSPKDNFLFDFKKAGDLALKNNLTTVSELLWITC